MMRLRELSSEVWANAESSQHRYARAAEGARELWRYVAGTEQRPAARKSVQEADCGFVLRLVSDTLQHHNTEQRGDVWRCTFERCGGCAFTVSHVFSCAHPHMRALHTAAAEKLTERLRALGAQHKHMCVLEWCRQLQVASRVDDSVTEAAAFGAFPASSMRGLLKRCGVGVDSGVVSEGKRGEKAADTRVGEEKCVVTVVAAVCALPALSVRGLSRRCGVVLGSGVDSEHKDRRAPRDEARTAQVAMDAVISGLRSVFLNTIWQMWQESLNARVRINVKPVPAAGGKRRAPVAKAKSTAGVKRRR